MKHFHFIPALCVAGLDAGAADVKPALAQMTAGTPRSRKSRKPRP